MDGAAEKAGAATSSLTVEQVRQVGHLSRLELTEEELERLADDLNVLLLYFSQLSSIGTEGVPPTSHVLELSNVLREDEIRPSLPLEEVLANAPESDGPFFVVPRIVRTG